MVVMLIREAQLITPVITPKFQMKKKIKIKGSPFSRHQRKQKII
jgi:hypothetical protein